MKKYGQNRLNLKYIEIVESSEDIKFNHQSDFN